MITFKQKSVLIVTSSERSKYVLKNTLLDHHFNYLISYSNSGNESRREMLVKSFDYVIINTPLLDEFGDKLAKEIKEKTSCEVIFIINNEFYGSFNEILMNYGILCLSKPYLRTTFYQLLDLLNTIIELRDSLKEENYKLSEKLKEERIISKAKCILIEKNRMTENEAHKYIEKKSMESRQRKFDVALDIINKS